MSTNEGRPSTEFNDAAKRLTPIWEQMSPELRTAMRAAWDYAADRQSACVNKLHLLLCLLKDGRVRSHVTLSERDVSKIESMVTDKLRVIGPQFDATAAGAQPQSPDWGGDLIAILGDAANKKKHYRHPSIDVWLVFDLLRCDGDLRGNFTYAQSGYANDHDVRINEISALTNSKQAEVNQLKADVKQLEAEHHKLLAEMAETRRVFDGLKAEVAQYKLQTGRVQPFEQRLQQFEQYLYQLSTSLAYLQGGVNNTVMPMVQQVHQALVGTMRPMQPPSGPAQPGPYGHKPAPPKAPQQMQEPAGSSWWPFGSKKGAAPQQMAASAGAADGAPAPGASTQPATQQAFQAPWSASIGQPAGSGPQVQAAYGLVQGNPLAGAPGLPPGQGATQAGMTGFMATGSTPGLNGSTPNGSGFNGPGSNVAGANGSAALGQTTSRSNGSQVQGALTSLQQQATGVPAASNTDVATIGAANKLPVVVPAATVMPGLSQPQGPAQSAPEKPLAPTKT